MENSIEIHVLWENPDTGEISIIPEKKLMNGVTSCFYVPFSRGTQEEMEQKRKEIFAERRRVRRFSK